MTTPPESGNATAEQRMDKTQRDRGSQGGSASRTGERWGAGVAGWPSRRPSDACVSLTRPALASIDIDPGHHPVDRYNTMPLFDRSACRSSCGAPPESARAESALGRNSPDRLPSTVRPAAADRRSPRPRLSASLCNRTGSVGLCAAFPRTSDSALTQSIQKPAGFCRRSANSARTEAPARRQSRLRPFRRRLSPDFGRFFSRCHLDPAAARTFSDGPVHLGVVFEANGCDPAVLSKAGRYIRG